MASMHGADEQLLDLGVAGRGPDGRHDPAGDGGDLGGRGRLQVDELGGGERHGQPGRLRARAARPQGAAGGAGARAGRVGRPTGSQPEVRRGRRLRLRSRSTRRSFDDPYPSYRVMRGRAPGVLRGRSPTTGCARATGCSAGPRTSTTPPPTGRTFSSAAGPLIDTDVALLPPNLFNMDPPRHDELRSVLSRVLTPSRIAGLEPHVRAYAQRAGRRAGAADGGLDASTEFAPADPHDHHVHAAGPAARGPRPVPASGTSTRRRRRLHQRGGAAGVGARWTRTGSRPRGPAPGQDRDPTSSRRSSTPTSRATQLSERGDLRVLLAAARRVAEHDDEHDHQRRDRRSAAARRSAAGWPTTPTCGPGRSRSCCATCRPSRAWPGTTTRDVTLHDVTIPAGRPGAAAVRLGQPRRDGLRRPRRRSTSTARSGCTGASATASTTAWATRWPASRSRVALQVLLETLGDWEVDEDRVERNQLVPTRCISHADITF